MAQTAVARNQLVELISGLKTMEQVTEIEELLEEQKFKAFLDSRTNFISMEEFDKRMNKREEEWRKKYSK